MTDPKIPVSHSEARALLAVWAFREPTVVEMQRLGRYIDKQEATAEPSGNQAIAVRRYGALVAACSKAAAPCFCGVHISFVGEPTTDEAEAMKVACVQSLTRRLTEHKDLPARVELAEQREREARQTAEQWRQESNDNLEALERVRGEREKFRNALADALEAWRKIPPHDMVILCPACGKQHLDIGEFATRVHRKHLCKNTPEGETGCGHLWVPFPYATRGVERVGFDPAEDTPEAASFWRAANGRWTDWAEKILGYRVDASGIMPGDDGQRERIAALLASGHARLRPAVVWFAGLMEEALKRNDSKGTWEDCHPDYLWDRLADEKKELGRAIGASVPDGEKIASEAADVANFAMMIADAWQGVARDASWFGGSGDDPAEAEEAAAEREYEQSEAHAREWFDHVRDNDGNLEQPLGPRGDIGVPYLTMRDEHARELFASLSAAIMANMRLDVVQVSLPHALLAVREAPAEVEEAEPKSDEDRAEALLASLGFYENVSPAGFAGDRDKVVALLRRVRAELGTTVFRAP